MRHDLTLDGNPGRQQRMRRMERNRFQSYHPVLKAVGGIAAGLVVLPLAAGYTYSQLKEDPGKSPHLLLPGTVAESGPTAGSGPSGERPPTPERPVPNGDETSFIFKPGTERSVVYCQQPYVSEAGEKISNALVSPGTYDNEYWHRANVEYKRSEITVGWTQDTYSTAGYWEVPDKPGTTMEHPDGMTCKQTLARAEEHPVVGREGTQLFLVDLDENMTHPAPGAPIDLSKPTPGVIDQHLGPVA